MLLLIILLGHRFLISIPELKKLQQQSDANEVERVVKALEYQQTEVSRFTYDYGVWDDTHEYIRSPNNEYIESNFIRDTFESLDINGVFIFDRAGQIVWTKTFHEEKGWIEPAKLFAKRTDLTDLALPDLGDELSEAVFDKGFLAGRHYPMLFARVSVLPSRPEGQPSGTFAMMRVLTPMAVQRVAVATQLDFKLFLIKDVGNNKALAELAPTLDLLKEQQVYRSQGKGYRWLRDLQGRPISLLQVELSPAIYSEQILDSATLLVLLVATLTMMIVRFALGLLVLRPLDRMRAHLKNIRDHANYTLRIGSQRADEIGDLARECDNLVTYVHAQEQYLKEINQDMTKKTLEDGLTEVANRRHFDVKLDLLWRAFAQKKQPVFLILIDVDNFKAFNDNYGHLKGDQALMSIADVLLSNVRVSTDMVARYGGEEFAILLSETDVTGVKVVCDKLLLAIRTLNITHEYSDVAPRITVSMGVSGWIPDSEDSASLVKSAEEALTQAKEAGRDCVQYHIRDDSISR